MVNVKQEEDDGAAPVYIFSCCHILPPGFAPSQLSPQLATDLLVQVISRLLIEAVSHLSAVGRYISQSRISSGCANYLNVFCVGALPATTLYREQDLLQHCTSYVRHS